MLTPNSDLAQRLVTRAHWLAAELAEAAIISAKGEYRFITPIPRSANQPFSRWNEYAPVNGGFDEGLAGIAFAIDLAGQAAADTSLKDIAARIAPETNLKAKNVKHDMKAHTEATLMKSYQSVVYDTLGGGRALYALQSLQCKREIKTHILNDFASRVFRPDPQYPCMPPGYVNGTAGLIHTLIYLAAATDVPVYVPKNVLP